MAISRQRRDRKLPLLIGLAVALMVPIILLIVYSCNYQFVFRDYIADLSESTTYAYRNGGMVVTDTEGARFAVTGDTVYRLYNRLTEAGPGKVQKALPSQGESMLFGFGDGSWMQVWRVPVENSRIDEDEGLFVCYQNQRGERYLYDTDMVLFHQIERDYPTP